MTCHLFGDEAMTRIWAGLGVTTSVSIRHLSIGHAAADERFQALLQRPSGQQNLVATAQAAESDISTQPHDRPLAVPARMSLSELNDIIEMQNDRWSW